MGSVIDYIDCPNCGHEAYDDFYYKTGEEYINCQNCGYHRSATIINREKPLNELTEQDWEIIELKNPYGAYRLQMVGDIGAACGSVETEEAFEGVKKAVAEMENVEYFSISRFVNGEIILETIYERQKEATDDRDTTQ
jgi:DNA-directed RNA polymerase subunit RPC12/RpoP